MTIHDGHWTALQRTKNFFNNILLVQLVNVATQQAYIFNHGEVCALAESDCSLRASAGVWS